MVLPLLGSFLGSALLPGMFSAGALSPLAAGAIGSGLGSLLQGDDLDEAIKLHNSVPQGLSSSIFTNSIINAETFLSHKGSDC